MLPTLEDLSRERSPYMLDINDYKTELTTGLNSAWKTAKECITVNQERQKASYGRTAHASKLGVGGQRVMVLMPSDLQGKTQTFARPFYGPYRILRQTPTNAEVRLVDQPKSDSIFVSFGDAMMSCPMCHGKAAHLELTRLEPGSLTSPVCNLR